MKGPKTSCTVPVLKHDPTKTQQQDTGHGESNRDLLPAVGTNILDIPKNMLIDVDIVLDLYQKSVQTSESDQNET